MSQLVCILVIVLLALTGEVVSRNGGDVSQYYGTSTWSCAVRNGWTFMSARAYRSYGAVDPNVVSTLAAAKAGGITYRDIYHFPCYGKISASQQIHDDINNVGLGNFGTIWMDIETNVSPGCGWGSDKAANCQFLGDLISAAQGMGATVGVYSSVYEWGQTVGSGCTVASALPLWYANYDGAKNYNDFIPFGGWTYPHIKQYADSVGGLCGLNADADWYPN